MLIVIGLDSTCLSAKANVFASNLKLNNVATNLMTAPGDGVTISYLLNHHADAGVTVSVVFGTNILWSTNLTSAGTNRGINSVVWDGRDSSGNVASNGLWLVSVTAASAGKTNWWKVPMVDNGLVTHNGEGHAWSPYGIAVNNNVDSPHFGRIFVGNAEESGDSNEAGDFKGIALYNADGSYAIAGGHSTGGWNWNPFDEFDVESPGKIEVGADDRVYVVDGSRRATVLSFDQSISTNSAMLALNHDTLFEAADSRFSGLAVTGTGTNRELLMADLYMQGVPGGLGVRRWALGAAGVASTSDWGTTFVNAGAGSDLDYHPHDVAVDSNERIYTLQYLGPFESSPRVLAFPAYQGSALNAASWTVASSFTNGLVAASGIATALHTNFLAVVSYLDTGNPLSVYRISTTNAALLTTDGDGLNSGSEHNYTDVAWDHAGNLYVTDWAESRWRAFSPPGNNQFTTTSLQWVKVGPYVQPTLQSVRWQTNQFQLQLNGEIGVNYIIEASSNLLTWTGVATNRAPATTSLWAVSSSSSRAFFRAKVLP